MAKRHTTTRDRIRAALRREARPCHICGGPIDYSLPSSDPQSFQADHIVPLARGGANTLANSAPSHRVCNRSKGSKDFAPIIKRSGSLRKPGA